MPLFVILPFECLRALSLSAMSSRPNGLPKRLLLLLVIEAMTADRARARLRIRQGEY